ncbi:MAG TPA: hypothetical protein VFW98_06070 [Gemmatimonadaceae bacterium]|nr:hypothetical protein [Gemmatimonadaceae bacterium]
MTLRKLFAIGVCVAILGAQIWVIAPPLGRSRTWYWPFLNYPMYSRSLPAGSVFKQYALDALPCAGGPAPIVVSDDLLGLRRFRAYDLLQSIDDTVGSAASRAAADSSMALIDHLVSTRSSVSLCTLRLRVQSITLGPDGVQDPDLVWSTVRSWPVHAPAERAAPAASGQSD